MDIPLTLFLCGDVMPGRGIDQILPHPHDPVIYESYLKSAQKYVTLAEKAHGSIPKPVDFSYIWGEALPILEQFDPNVRIINLETSITCSPDYWKDKSIHYRMHPDNIPCLTAANIDCCVLANNHVLDWGYAGLTETLKTLRQAGIKTAGAGLNLREAAAPARINIPRVDTPGVDTQSKGSALVLSYGMGSSGIPGSWAALPDRPGVNLLPDLSPHTVSVIRDQVEAVKQPGDVVIASIHWGENWGYEVSAQQQAFAHQLIDQAGVDLIHGHSSHHVKGIEVYQDKLILYGCGDFLNDYEGISGYESYRGDLGLMYFPVIHPVNGRLLSLTMIPSQIKNFRVRQASSKDSRWLQSVLNREGKMLHTWVEDQSGSLTLHWDST